jgi:hypothetical protein
LAVWSACYRALLGEAHAEQHARGLLADRTLDRGDALDWQLTVAWAAAVLRHDDAVLAALHDALALATRRRARGLVMAFLDIEADLDRLRDDPRMKRLLAQQRPGRSAERPHPALELELEVFRSIKETTPISRRSSSTTYTE